MRFLFTASLVCLCFASTLAQRQEIFTGIVVDSASFTPLAFVSIQIKNTMRGTSTDAQGNFSLMATQADSIVISLIGYQTEIFPLRDWEPGLIRLSERSVLLKGVTVSAKVIKPYEGMFDEENARIAARKSPFYYSKARKEKRRLGWLREDNIRVQTYVNVVVKNDDIKMNLMERFKLTEKEYYDLLTRFNEANYTVMYHITAGELVTLINDFFERNAPLK
jgi:hypothetical protein